MLVLEDDLLYEMIDYTFDIEYNKVLIKQLLLHFKPCITSDWQLENLEIDYDILKQLENKPFINRIVELESFEELVRESYLKLMLVTSIDKNKTFKQVNITNDGMKTLFSQTYKKGEKREDVKEHIKDLIANQSKITIKDKYLFKKWSENSKVLNEILPTNGELEIFIDFNETNDLEFKLAENELKKFRKSMRIEIKEYENRKFHDRYIICDNMEIILSSGLYYLENREKDLTYIVRVKN